ncbi:MAG: M20/M25/M40 family metallo-hydrolase [candidate division KSB1 bacterium]|nr:M20/M25/M40 family metallo-hydrolase [candidate division KSB1 bacterium]MDZ7305144.1 M20/M25/M40 family metallo-hydrolase [candidate division KSB1 bacterium]MDZ7314228.1 M20/M25/M40 family metallo-hydrolase [candidate division KSB1 bacterium]
MQRYRVILVLFLLVCVPMVFAQEPVDLYMVSRIKAEGFQNSQVMETLFWLTDVHGPRLSGSPNFKAACEWSRDQLTKWGLANAHLESWGTFGRGWTTEKFSIEMIAPQYQPIIAWPQAWTAGTNGVVSGTPILVDIKNEDDLAKYKGILRGAIVLTQKPREAETHFEADARRRDEKNLTELALAPEPGAPSPWAARREEFRARRALQEKMMKLLRDENAAVLLEPSRGEHGTVFVDGGSRNRNAEPGLPTLTVAIEHYSRIARLLEKGLPVKLEINVQNRFYDNDTLGYNVIAEIPGIDKKLKDEVVMLGAHLDSWHAGTGATDDASGCAVVMEAVRILKTLGVQPRRTIRIALWGAEEQGLLGSRGYVKQHFADPADMKPKPEHEKFSAYFNFDNGTGKIRGVYLQNNDMVRPIFEAWLKPFHDLGATTLTIRNTGGTDHLSFDAVGLPGFQFIQDEIDYGTRTHHTNMDVYDHALQGDLMQASVIMASFVYHAAMRDEKLPRKQMPKPEQQPRMMMQ